MSNETYPIVGIPVQDGQPLPLRQEITAWANNEGNDYQLSLFLRSLAKLKDKPVEEKLGFFQIAGIHSYPLVPWDGQGQPTQEKPNPPGFCNHNLVTFPTWHRPYMLLYEQVLYENMLELIDSWKDISDEERSIWSTAACQFRLPYWDWAQKQPYIGNFGIPEICTQPEVNIVEPGKSRATKAPFKNPLTGFLNPKKDQHGKRVPMGDQSMGPNAIRDNEDSGFPNAFPWSKCIGVSRYGIRTDKPEAEWINGVNNWPSSNESIAGTPFNAKASTVADAVSRVFSPSYFQHWETFASTRYRKEDENSAYLSLEAIHNYIHDATGGLYMSADEKSQGSTALGLGHMADVPVAAFDPIFWLHHCNVDRLCAIWQVLNWNKWFDNPNSEIKDPLPSDALLPFHYNKTNNSWTSDMSRDWRLSKYQYDDLKDMPAGEPPTEYVHAIREHVNKLYPSTSKLVSQTSFYSSAHETFDDYLINIVYDRYALNGKAYSILFYIGEPTTGFSAAKTDPNFVGAVYTFSAPFVSADGRITCDNCGKQDAAKALSEGQIPLVVPLINIVNNSEARSISLPVGGGLLEAAEIERVFEVGLQWYFVEQGGRVAHQSEFPRTEIAVLKGEGRLPVGDHVMPTYGNYSKLPRVTEGKPLGFGHPLGPNDLIKDD